MKVIASMVRSEAELKCRKFVRVALKDVGQAGCKYELVYLADDGTDGYGSMGPRIIFGLRFGLLVDES